MNSSSVTNSATPYDKGYAAFQNNAEINDNPYKMTMPEFTEWEDGYLDAQSDTYHSGNYSS